MGGGGGYDVNTQGQLIPSLPARSLLCQFLRHSVAVRAQMGRGGGGGVEGGGAGLGGVGRVRIVFVLGCCGRILS